MDWEWLPGHIPNNLIDGPGRRGSPRPLRFPAEIGAWLGSGLRAHLSWMLKVAIEIFDDTQRPQTSEMRILAGRRTKQASMHSRRLRRAVRRLKIHIRQLETMKQRIISWLADSGGPILLKIASFATRFSTQEVWQTY